MKIAAIIVTMFALVAFMSVMEREHRKVARIASPMCDVGLCYHMTNSKSWCGPCMPIDQCFDPLGCLSYDPGKEPSRRFAQEVKNDAM
jgi:hypothetical protein